MISLAIGHRHSTELRDRADSLWRLGHAIVRRHPQVAGPGCLSPGAVVSGIEVLAACQVTGVAEREVVNQNVSRAVGVDLDAIGPITAGKTDLNIVAVGRVQLQSVNVVVVELIVLSVAVGCVVQVDAIPLVVIGNVVKDRRSVSCATDFDPTVPPGVLVPLPLYWTELLSITSALPELKS